MKPLFGIAESSSNQTAQFVWRSGPRFSSMSPSDSPGPPQSAECDVHIWKAPDDSQVLVGLVVPCPHCKFPILVNPDQRAAGISPDGRLTLRQVTQCPGRWRIMDAHGNVRTDRNGSPKIARCGWAAVIVDGTAHNPQCPKLSGQSCRCGQELSPGEAAAVATGRA